MIPRIFNITRWEKLSIRIIVLFTIFMLGTFIPEFFKDFFGDVYVPFQPSVKDVHWEVAAHTEWGIRHYWWCAMSVCLFAIQAIRLILFIVQWVDPKSLADNNIRG